MRIRTMLIGLLTFAMALCLAACSSREPGESLATQPAAPSPTPEEQYRYNQMMDRDTIRPVYDPEFIHASEATLGDDQLVLGVAVDGEAKAYPIVVLNSREMVNDELAGIPILPTW